MEKNHYFSSFLAAVLFSFGLSASAQVVNPTTKTLDKSFVNYKPSVTKMAKPVVMKGVPTKLPQSASVYNLINNDWVLVKNTTKKFNEKLLCVDEVIINYNETGIKNQSHFTYSYNANDKIEEKNHQIKKAVGADWINYKRNVSYYDDICTDVMLTNNVYDWDESTGAWVRTYADMNSFYTDVERDAAGRVNFKQAWDSEEKNNQFLGTYFTYDSETGPASKVALKALSKNNVIEETHRYEDLVWHKSNEQYLKTTNNIYFMFNNDPQNMIESFTLYEIQNGEKSKFAMVKNSYDEHDRITSIQLNMIAYDMNYIHIYDYDFDGKGNNRFFSARWDDLNGNNSYDEGEAYLDEISQMREFFDEYGNTVTEEYYMYNNETGKVDKLTEKRTNEITYLEDGTVKQVISTRVLYKMDGVEEEKIKYVYDEFVDQETTGVDELTGKTSELIAYNGCVVALNMEGAAYTVADLQGRVCLKGTVTGSKISLNSLAKGIYVVNVNGKSVKVVNK